nr:unnamed protein product [Digitaria exilis]
MRQLRREGVDAKGTAQELTRRRVIFAVAASSFARSPPWTRGYTGFPPRRLTRSSSSAAAAAAGQLFDERLEAEERTPGTNKMGQAHPQEDDVKAGPNS